MNMQRGMRGKLDKYLNINVGIQVSLHINGPAVYNYICFGLDDEDRILGDGYMVSSSHPQSPGNEIAYASADGGAKFDIDLSKLPQGVSKLVFAAGTGEDSSMGEILSHVFAVGQAGHTVLEMSLSGKDFSSEHAVVSLEIYRKDGGWRFCAVARGCNGGLSGLLRGYGYENKNRTNDLLSPENEQNAGIPHQNLETNFGEIAPNYHEPWYLRTSAIAILVIVLSMINFGAILVIPLVAIKSNRARKYIESNISVAMQEAKKTLNNAQEQLASLNADIANKAAVVQEIKANAKHEAELEISMLKSTLSSLDAHIAEKKALVVELDETILLQDFALYEPVYDFTNSEQYKQKLDVIRESQKQMIRQNNAASGYQDWTVNGSVSEGKKMVRDTQKLLLRAFNGECEYVTGKVKYNNFDSCKKRITNAYTAISKLGRTMNISISPEYYSLKIDELHVALEYQQMKQKEKDRQKELREQAREEAKLKKEIEEARKKIEKEHSHYTNALESAKAQLVATADEEGKAALMQKISELELHINEINDNLADIDYREANQRAGYVYVISNIGSFGEDVYKIGMTRRLDPMERVYELGGASVPFNFDVHAMIFSDDAPRLEAALHHAFEDKN